MTLPPTASHLDSSLLSAFLVVVGEGRISSAAKVRHLSQPAVTAQMRRLEEALGASLFTRSVRGVVPTPAGERLAEYARTIQRLLDEAVSEVGGNRELSGELVVAASTTAAAHVLPPLLAQFRAQHRQLGLRVHVGNTEDVIGTSEAGSLHWGSWKATRGLPGFGSNLSWMTS